MSKYKVTLYLEANTHPRFWYQKAIQQSLEHPERILSYRIEEIIEDDNDE